MKTKAKKLLSGFWLHLLNGLAIAPYKAMTLYLVINYLDLYLTWLVTPDLKFEVNWMILLFGFGWKFMLWREIITNVFLLTGLIISVSVFQQHYQHNPGSGKSVIKEICGNFRLFLCAFIKVSVYIDLFYSIFLIVPSNYLQYLYVYKIHNFWTGLSDLYVNKIILQHIWFTRLMYPVFAAGGILYTIYIIRKTKINGLKSMAGSHVPL